MKNPYRWNQINLQIVYGRTSVIDEMLRELPAPSGNSFGLSGARRMGKTTLLRFIEEKLHSEKEVLRASGTQIVPIYIDGLALPRPLKAEFVWAQILKRICAGLNSAILSPPAEVDFTEFLELVAGLLAQVELVPKIVVIIDEVELFLIYDWADSFFGNWRALLSNYPEVSKYFSAVFSGAREMINLQHDVGSPLGDVLEWRNLQSLSDTESYSLMTQPLQLRIGDEVLEYSYEETGGHPMIVQYLMQKSLNASSQVTLESIDLSIKDFEANRAWQFSDWWEKYCDENSRRIYSSLPADMTPIQVSIFAAELGGHNASKAFQILQHVGIVAISDENDCIKRRGIMFSRWQIKFGNHASSALALDLSLAALLEAIHPDFRAKYVSAWTIYSQVMPNYSGAVSEMRDLITLILHSLAPDEQVTSQPGFKFERDQTKPTRRQRVMFVFKDKKEQAKSVASDDELLDSNAVRLASIISTAYSNASSLTHTTASRELAFTSLKQSESILVQLISAHNTKKL
jgi:hypothetical protein